MIPIIISFRGALFASILVALLGIFVIVSSSKEKEDYTKTVGRIEYLKEEFRDLPARHVGDFRYLKVENYPYHFEIYEPNSKPAPSNIDDLKVGDTISIYYYETSDTRNVRLNRFAQFIDHKDKAHYIRNSFQKNLGFILLILSALVIILAFIFWKVGKLNW